MIASLPLFHRISGQTVLILGDGEAADAKRKLVERSGAIFSADIAEAKAAGARLAFVAVEDDDDQKWHDEENQRHGSEGWQPEVVEHGMDHDDQCETRKKRREPEILSAIRKALRDDREDRRHGAV